MINIATLPPIIQTVLRNDPFIFTAANGKQMNIESLSAIVRANDVTHVIDVLPRYNYSSGKHPFYLQHTDLFKEAQELFFSIFGVEPDMLIYAYKEDNTSSIFLFLNKSFIEKSIRKEEIELKITSISDNIGDYRKQVNAEINRGVEVDNVRIENSSALIKLPKGVYPVIGALNSIDSGWRTPNFNLVFGTEYLANLDNTINADKSKVEPKTPDILEHNSSGWQSNIDEFIVSKFKHGISLYSIDRFEFKFDSNLNEYYDPFTVTNYYREAISKTRVKFVGTIISFLLAVNRGRYLPITVEQFSAFMPHFYGFDRTLESVRLADTTYKNKLKRNYDTALSFATSKLPDLTCKNFIDYFLRDSIINFAALKIDPGSEILKAFKDQPQIPLLIGNKRKEILSGFITSGIPNASYSRFLNDPDGQVSAKNKIYSIL